MSLKPRGVRANLSRRCARAEVERRAAASIMLSALILSRESQRVSALGRRLGWARQLSTRAVIRGRSGRSARRVPPTVGVWQTVRERAQAAYTWASEGARGPQVCRSGSARSPWAWRRAERGLPTPAGPKHTPIVRCWRIVGANSVNRRCFLVALQGPVRWPTEPAGISWPRHRYRALAQSAGASQPLAQAEGGAVPAREENRPPVPSAH
jgi:hypothetical protein